MEGLQEYERKFREGCQGYQLDRNHFLHSHVPIAPVCSSPGPELCCVVWRVNVINDSHRKIIFRSLIVAFSPWGSKPSDPFSSGAFSLPNVIRLDLFLGRHLAHFALSTIAYHLFIWLASAVKKSLVKSIALGCRGSGFKSHFCALHSLLNPAMPLCSVQWRQMSCLLISVPKSINQFWMQLLPSTLLLHRSSVIKRWVPSLQKS